MFWLVFKKYIQGINKSKYPIYQDKQKITLLSDRETDNFLSFSVKLLLNPNS